MRSWVLLGLLLCATSARAQDTAYEVKRLVNPADLQRLLDQLGLAGQAPARRDVTFVDSEDLALVERGVVLRVRSGRELETTVKVPAPDPAQDPPPRRGVKVEVDVSGDRHTRTRSHESSSSAAFSPDEPLARFDAEQLETARKAFGGELPARLVAFGPTVAERWSVERSAIPGQPRALRGKLNVERWTLVDGTHVLEVSLRAKQDEVASTVEWLDRLLAGAGVKLEVAQSTKTRRALRRSAPAAGLTGPLTGQ